MTTQTSASRIAVLSKRVLREPLVHFLVLGAALFLANSLIHGEDQGPTSDLIIVSEGRVNQVAESYLLLAGRLPSRVELESLVDDFISEEVDYREAVAMGLDADDTIVRRRMRQKLEFLTEDAAASEEPSEKALEAWLADHAESYVLPKRCAIRQVLASTDRRGEAAGSYAQALLSRLNEGADPSKLGDASMLPGAMPLTTEAGAAALFGSEFAKAVFEHEGASWFGPIASPFGFHLVQVIKTEPGRALRLSEARDKIRSDWIEARRDKARDDAQARMRKRYTIKIAWPDPWKGLPETANPNPKTKRSPEVGE